MDPYNRQVAEYIPIVYVFKETPVILAETIVDQSIQWGVILHTSIWLIYIIGLSFFLFRFIKGLRSIYKLFREGEKANLDSNTLITTSENHLPFSFLNMVFISKDLPLNEDYNRILTHELAHVKARHSLDVLILEIINIIFWFHPMIYLYKSALRQTHEYLADAAVCGNDSRQLYGQLLLRQSLSGLEIALAHQFFHSHIKKRINMIYQEKSGRKAWLKYAMAVPALVLLLLVFTSHDSKLEDPFILDDINYQTETHESTNDNKLTEKQKNRLRSEVQEILILKTELSTLEKEKQLTDLIKKWNKKFPKKQASIRGTISFTIFREKMVLTTDEGIIKIRPLPLSLPNRATVEKYNLLSTTIPTIDELTNNLKSNPYPSEIALVHHYLLFQSYYSKNGKLKGEILNLFEQYIKEKEFQLPFNLKDIQLHFNITTPKIIQDYINSNDESHRPLFWGQSMGLFTPHRMHIDVKYPIGFFAYLTPKQAIGIYGPQGDKGLIAVSNYTLHPEHPELQSQQLSKDIENFFSTIDQISVKNWANKLKEVNHSLKNKYPNARDHITPYTSIAHKHNITLVFKDKKIIKAYRGDGNSTERIDSEASVNFPIGTEIPSPPKKKLNKTKANNSEKYLSSDFKLSQPFIKSVYENFIVPKVLRSKGIESAVVVLLNVNRNNRVTNYRVAHSLNDQLSISAEQTMKAVEGIDVLDGSDQIDISKTYAINFIIEHDDIINSSSDSLLNIVREDTSIEILDEFNIMYYFKPSTDKKRSAPKKSKSTSDSKSTKPYIIGGYNKVFDSHPENILISKGEIIKDFSELTKSDDNIVLTTLPEEEALAKYPELKNKRIIEVTTKKSMSGANPSNTISPTSIANFDSFNHADTIFTYDPETYTETIEIIYSNEIPSFPPLRKTVKRNSAGPMTIDTIMIFDPVTCKETYALISYPSHLTSNSPQVQAADFQYKIDKKNKSIHISGASKTNDISLQAEDGSKRIVFHKYTRDQDAFTFDVSAFSSGDYYLSSIVDAVEVMKRIQLE